MNDEGIEDLPMDSGPERPELVSDPSPVVDAPKGPARDESGRFASKDTGEQPVAEPETVEAAPPTPGENPIPESEFKGYLTEKRKRQELEQQVQAMQAQLQQFQQQQQSDIPEDFWEDPNSFLESRLNQFGQTLLQQFQQQQVTARIDASEAAARAKYSDFEDVFASFRNAADANPTLYQQMAQASDPAEFAYQKGKTAATLAQVGSIDELLKAERAKWEAEARSAIAAPRPNFPASTVSDGSVSGRSAPVWTGDVNDRDILPMG